MAGKKVGEEHIRKLQRTGEDGASYMLTIPKHIIKDLGWQEHEKVVVKQDGDKLIVTNWEE